MVRRCLMLLLGIVLAFPVPFADSQTNGRRLVRVWAFNYYPGIFRSSDGETKGFLVDVLDQIASVENWRVEYVYGSWAEGLERIRTGEVDLLTSVAFTPERAAFLDFGQVPILTVWSQLFTGAHSKLNGILEMEGQTVAVMKGDFNGAAFVKHVEQFNISCKWVEVADFDAVFRAIEDGQADAGVVNSVFGLARHTKYDVKPTGVVFNPFNIHFAVLRGRNGDVLATLDRYLDAWRGEADSPFQKAVERWSGREVSVIRVVSPWATTALWVLSAVIVLSFAFNLALRFQVRRATGRIRENEKRFRQVTETVREVFWIVAPAWSQVLYISPAYEEVWGKSGVHCFGRFQPVPRDARGSTAQRQNPPAPDRRDHARDERS